MDRYGKPAADCRIPLGEAARQTYAEGIERDGLVLLAAVSARDAPQMVRRTRLLEHIFFGWQAALPWFG